MKAIYAYIDASNIIYGTRDEGWKVDFQKLIKYLKERHGCEKVFYFGGQEEGNELQARFYKKIRSFGYDLMLKQVKIYTQEDGSKIKKANCDVDLTFYAMRDLSKFRKVLFLSGDGDFEVLLKHMVFCKKEVIIYANSKRTARTIKELRGVKFNDLRVLRSVIEYLS